MQQDFVLLLQSKNLDGVQIFRLKSGIPDKKTFEVFCWDFKKG